MYECFACRKVMSDLETLFSHIEKHKIIKKKGIFQCTVVTCWQTFDNWSNFKNHVKRCYAKRPLRTDIGRNDSHAQLYIYSYDEKLFQFEETVNNAMVEYVLGLCANMKTPRNEVFKNTASLQKTVLAKVISGIKDIIGSRLPPEEKSTMDYFVEILESSMEGVKTESNLNISLGDLGLIGKLTKFDLCEFEEAKKPRKKRKKRDSVSAVSMDTEAADEIDETDEIAETDDDYMTDGTSRKRRINESDDEISEEPDSWENYEVLAEHGGPETAIKLKRGEVLVMPIVFQIKKFFELPNVFEKVRENTLKLQSEKKLNHYINGEVWKSKMKMFKPDQMVIPFHFYSDGAQINNPLGPHIKPGELQFNYLTFPTFPSQFHPRLENYIVAQIYPAKHHQDYTTEKIYNSLIGIFKTLSEKGVNLKINGEEITVFFVCGQFLGDNKEQNQRMSFSGSMSGGFCCRICKTHYNEIKTKENSNDAIRRNVQNYDEDVATNCQAKTGIKEFSVFNTIPCFHVTNGLSVDLDHDLLEGILHPSLASSILYFIDKDYFDLDFLNDKMNSMDYGEAEKGNKPVSITLEKLKLCKLKMTASEMFFFVHHLTLMIGDKIPRNDKVWQHIKTTVEFVDLCYHPESDDHAMEAVALKSEKLSKGLKELFGRSLQHKSHITSHYDKLIAELGPLRYFRTIRCEGKHKEMKNYAKNTNSRRNLPFSIGKKIQYQFAYRLIERRGLEEVISIPKFTRGSLQDQEYYAELLDDPTVTEISRVHCYFAKKVVVNGIIFSKELWLPCLKSGRLQINEVIDIVFLNSDIKKIYVVCKTYTRVTYDEHYVCQRVDMSSFQDELTVTNVDEYLTQHLYPVKVHKIGEDNYLFRQKHF